MQSSGDDDLADRAAQRAKRSIVGGARIGDQAVDAVGRAIGDAAGLADLAVVGEDQHALGGGRHRAGDVRLLEVEAGRTIAMIDADRRQQRDVGLPALDLGHRGRAERRRQSAAELAAEHDDAIAALAGGSADDGCDLERVGDDGQARQCRELAREDRDRRADVEKQDLAGADHARRRLRDARLLRKTHAGAHRDRRLGFRRDRRDAAMDTAQLAARFERENVAAHGLAGDAEIGGDAVGGRAADGGEQRADALVAVLLQHHRRPLRAASHFSASCIASAAAQTTSMMQVENAAACDTNPASSSRITETAAMPSEGVTRKITADKVTIERMNRKKNTETRVGVITGMMTLASTSPAPLPRQVAASSSAGGTARMPVTIVRKPWV